MEYTEHKKLEERQDESQTAGKFLEWLESKGLFLCSYVDGFNYPRPYHYTTEKLLAEWLGVDPIELEKEKRHMLSAMRAEQQEESEGK